MPKTGPWHSVEEPHHHNNTQCGPGSEIPQPDRVSGTGGKQECEGCAKLNGAAIMMNEATRQSETKRCPFCAEEILAAAIRCKHCGSDLPRPNTDQLKQDFEMATEPETRGAWWNNLRERWIVGNDEHLAASAAYGEALKLWEEAPMHENPTVLIETRKRLEEACLRAKVELAKVRGQLSAAFDGQAKKILDKH
jgi:hypothetical protein